MANKAYRMEKLDLNHLATALADWLQAQEYETQILETPGGLTLQARSEASWVQRQGVALQVQMLQQQENLRVEVGTSKWTMQAVSGVAAAIIFWPLMALPAFAAYKQKQIIDETWRWLDQYVASGGDVAVDAEPFAPIPEVDIEAEEELLTCGACGEVVSAGAKFCSNCGNKLRTVCEQCGAELLPGAKFCEGCGAKVGANEEG